MGLLGKILGRKKPSVSRYRETYQKLFDLFLPGPKTEEEDFLIRRFLDSPEAYHESCRFCFEEVGVGENTDFEDMVWMGFFLVLEELERAGRIKPGEDLDMFRATIDKIDHKGVFPVRNDELFDEEGEVGDWIRALEDHAKEPGFCIGEIDIHRDAYVLCMTDRETLRKMEERALEMGRVIRRFERRRWLVED